MQEKPVLAIIGGTGALGLGLTKRWALAGYRVVIGTRSPERVKDVMPSILEACPQADVSSADYVSAAEQATVVVIVVPFSSHAETLNLIRQAVQGKVVIDAVVPLVPPKVSIVQMPSEGSASIIAQNLLGNDVKVVGAFHSVAATKLHTQGSIDCDVLITGNDQQSRTLVLELTSALGLRGVDAGVLQNSIAVEAMTSLLIGINRRYKVDSAGIRITGIS